MGPKSPERAGALENPQAWLLKCLNRHGRNSFSGCLLYDSIRYFLLQSCEGFVGYLDAAGMNISMGEPVCAPENYGRAAEEFIAYSREQGRSCVFVIVGQEFVDATSSFSWTRAVVGEDMIFDLEHYAPRGNYAKKVRSARNQAVKKGAVVREYPRAHDRDLSIENRITEIGERWLKSLPKYQMHLLSLDLFKMA